MHSTTCRCRRWATPKRASVAERVDQLRELIASPQLLAAADPADLRVAETLRRTWPAELVAAATEQAVLRQRAAAKFTRATEMLFTRDGLEQASGENVARHRARRFAAAAPDRVLDLCCGIGGDLLALGSATTTVISVDRDETHAVLARHNANVYGVDAATAVADVHDIHLSDDTAVFVDPARRTTAAAGGRRGGYSPALDWCLALPVERVTIKTAPGLDLSVVANGWEAEFVAVGRELKECVLWSPGWGGARRRATLLPAMKGGDAVEVVPDPDRPGAPVRPPGRFLLDPSPAITRAGAVADVAAALDAWQIDPRIAFLSADHALRSPYGRGLTVEASLSFNLKALRAELRRLDVGSIDIRRRGLAGDVDDLRRRLATTGSRQATVVLTRVADKPWAFICTDADSA
jgi:SAM-dependent methyltransferase